jgi:hypothetical protein
MTRHPISRGDMLRLFAYVGDDEQERQRAAALLGFVWHSAVTASPLPPRPMAPPSATIQPATTPPSRVSEPESDWDHLPNEIWLSELKKPFPSGSRSQWYAQTQPLEFDTAPDRLPRLVAEPLLAPMSQRVMLLAMLATFVSGHNVDLRRLIDRIAVRTPLRKIPHLRKRSVRRGVQLLLDVGERMQPFFDDQIQLIEYLTPLMPEGRIQVVRCHGAPPARPFAGEYLPPSPGTPILLVSDLGRGGGALSPFGARADVWIDFARHMEALGCHVLVLAPVSQDKIGPKLREFLHIVTWDRTLTEGQFRRSRPLVGAAVR